MKSRSRNRARTRSDGVPSFSVAGPAFSSVAKWHPDAGADGGRGPASRIRRISTEILFESSPLFRSQNARSCLSHQADELTHVIPAGARPGKVFGFAAHSCMGGSANAPLILFQVTSSVSGKMRVSPTPDRKLASATHRGNTCI